MCGISPFQLSSPASYSEVKLDRTQFNRAGMKRNTADGIFEIFYEVVKVKISDLEDNMNIRRFNVLEEKNLKLLNKYLRAWKYMAKEGN
jgi:translation elongation factor EF-Ts